VFVFVAGAHAATIELQETWREGVDAALQELKVLGVEVAILTGDASSPAAQFPGVLLRPGMTPADKHDYVEELVSSGRSVLFVGDGVNDAAAMSAAQSSIAMQAGADLAHAAAIAVARAARRNIRVNLRFAAAYNITGMAFAAAGVLHPVVAALLMVGSSAFVSVNALRTDGPGNRERSRLPIPVVPGPVDSGSST
jgi:P-type E1-E2 ATPase